MDTLGDLLDKLLIERRDVIRLAAGDEAVVNNDRLVDPVCSGIFQVGLDRLVRGHSLPFDESGVNERPRTVANGSDWLARFVERSHELERPLVATEFVGIHHTARQYQSIKTVRPRRLEWYIDCKLIAPFGVVPAFHFARVGRYDGHLRARFFQRLLRPRQLDLFKTIGDEHRNPLLVQLSRHFHSPYRWRH